MANKRVQRSLNKIASILTVRPQMVGQVSTETLSQVPLGGDPSGSLGINVKTELGKRYSDSAYVQTGRSPHSYRTPRNK